jgi:hypothetical protein
MANTMTVTPPTAPPMMAGRLWCDELLDVPVPVEIGMEIVEDVVGFVSKLM